MFISLLNAVGFVCLFKLRLYVPDINILVMSDFPSLKQRMKYLTQGHNIMTPSRDKPEPRGER